MAKDSRALQGEVTGAMFKNVVRTTHCPFAGNATWREVVSAASKPLSQQAVESADRLRPLISAAEQGGQDMCVLRIDSPEVTSDIGVFTRFVGTLLSHLSRDPRSMGDDDVMLRHGWRYWVGDVQCFVLSFAPFYGTDHPRHSPTHAAYLVFQFESSFERNGVTRMTPSQLVKLGDTVRSMFEERGIDYLAEITHEAPESLHVIKPLRAGDPPVHWWRHADLAPRSDEPLNALDVLTAEGHIVFERVLPERTWFTKLYELYDEIVDGLTDQSSTELRRAALDWLGVDDNRSYYCGAPCGFRDRSGLQQKRDKAYLQYCLEFARSPQFAGTTVAGSKAMQELNKRLERVEEVCSRLFRKALHDIGDRYIAFRARYADDRPLPVIIKMIRYNWNPTQFATDPHYDKSALSLILNADDESVRWRLGRGDNCPLSSMVAPFEYPDSPEEPNSCVLFSGLCLQPCGVELPPTPHFVMPVEQGRYRHSVIAFLLVPHLPDTESFNTQALYVHDVMRDIR